MNDIFFSLLSLSYPKIQQVWNIFKNNFEIPTLELGEAEDLDQDLKQEEIKSAILAMQSSNTTGPGGYHQNFIRNLRISSNQFFKYLKNL